MLLNVYVKNYYDFQDMLVAQLQVEEAEEEEDTRLLLEVEAVAIALPRCRDVPPDRPDLPERLEKPEVSSSSQSFPSDDKLFLYFLAQLLIHYLHYRCLFRGLKSETSWTKTVNKFQYLMRYVLQRPAHLVHLDPPEWLAWLPLTQ